MTTALEVAERIESELHNQQYDASEVTPNFHSALVTELRARGWQFDKSLSYCKKASEETLLAKGGKSVEIITASFMGTFHQITSHYRVR